MFMLIRSSGAFLASAMDCDVEGGAGESAHLNNGGTRLFTFPESATNIWSDCSNWQEAFIHVRFDMDADELEAFLDSMLWDVRPLTSTDASPPFGDPEPNATYLYGVYSNPSNTLIVGVWADANTVPYRVFVNVWHD
ncbi:MAG: hypothetical protein JXB30_03230 [Anaerolineae bacterium]|nr:hypothetical protein [Anaerolineae bacterium]